MITALTNQVSGEPGAAHYERASLIVTSNKPFGAWGEIVGDEPAGNAGGGSTTTSSSPTGLAGTKCKDDIQVTDHANDDDETTDERVAA